MLKVGIGLNQISKLGAKTYVRSGGLNQMSKVWCRKRCQKWSAKTDVESGGLNQMSKAGGLNYICFNDP